MKSRSFDPFTGAMTGNHTTVQADRRVASRGPARLWSGLRHVAALSTFAATCACAGVAEEGSEAEPYIAHPDAEDPNVAEHGERYIVTFAEDDGATAAVQAAGATMARSLPTLRAVAAYMPETAALSLKDDPGVVDVEPDPKRYPLGETMPYGIAMVEAEAIAGTAQGSTTVCVIDSGLSLGHEDLSDEITASPANGAGEPLVDGCGHGTHVAGTIAALQNDVGVVGVDGTGRVKLHVVKVFSDGCGWTYGSTLIAALDECLRDATTDNVVVNMSLGGSGMSRAEEAAFQRAHASGRVLSVAAAGNDGSTRDSYPASYESVISVGALDASKRVAGFSQRNPGVELAAPGVGVLSTMSEASVLYTPASALTVGGAPAAAPIAMAGSPSASVSGALVDCGTGQAPCAGAAGAVCLIARGAIAFSEKVLSCEAGGGIGAVIYNSSAGALYGTLGGALTHIPSVGVSGVEGAVLLGMLGQTATLTVDVAPGYTAISGTSMATPHVAGGAALLWSHFPWLSGRHIRHALSAGAEDLGEPGRDDAYGNGLLQIAAAYDVLREQAGCVTDADCDDGNTCNGFETCSSGVCAGGVDAPAGMECGDDGNACNGFESCDGSGTCASSGPLSCGEGERCDEALGCVAQVTCLAAGKRCQGGAHCCSGVCTKRGKEPARCE